MKKLISPTNAVIWAGIFIGANLPGAQAVPAKLTIDIDKPGAKVSPVMHGVFFEDINYGADGGLYAELVQNRSFEHEEHLYSWSLVNRAGDGTLLVGEEAPLNVKNTHYLRLKIKQPGQGFGIANSGFGGIAVKAGEKYIFSVHARAGTKPFDPETPKIGREKDWGKLKVLLEGEKGTVLGECQTGTIGSEWHRYEGIIECKATTANARLVVLAEGAGVVDLDVISLFPQNTFNKRRNGLRADLVQKLADMKPGFMRFPGGCIVEGTILSNAYRWKDTIGDVAERPQNWNRWQDAVSTKAPQYYQTYGLGFFEYFQLCEDIGAEPVPILNCGMACQYQSGQLVPLAELDPYIQDALDLIEFANGPRDSKWGKIRAQMGHPKPFNLKYLGVGNEQWAAPYFERYPLFQKAIKDKYPAMQIVTSAGPGVDDNNWRFAWDKFKNGMPADIVDEHYYRSPQWFLENDHRYDNYDRKGPKVFAGEFAAHLPNRKNSLGAAIAEAAFMTGLLRNAEVVHMASYAPLFAKIGNTQWAPDLIWFDNTHVYASPSYHVQAMYSRNRPDVVLPVTLDAPESAAALTGTIGIGTWSTQAEFKDIEVSRDGKTLWKADPNAGLTNWETHNGDWKIADGAIRQNAEATDVQLFAGDATWSDYTLSLKARKIAGKEGFMIYFARGENGVGVWNVGGWGNAQHGLDLDGQVARIPGKVETGRWYDVRVELRSQSVKCYLDGKLIQEGTRKSGRTLYAVAGRDEKSGEVIVDVVNPSERAIEAILNLRGAKTVAAHARATVLSGEANDENSLEQPDKVTPREIKIDGVAVNFAHSFPAHSFTVMRLKAK